MMRRKRSTGKKMDVRQRDNRIRAVFAAAWLLCIAGLALLYGPFCPDGMTLTYALLSAQLPALSAVRPPQYGLPETEDDPQDARITIDRADVDSGVGSEIRIELAKQQDGVPQLDLSGEEPRILIYHTHTTEAYTQTEQYPYEEAGEWRTRENDRNIVAVGEKLAQLLREEYGFSVLHDTTDHEPPKLGTAYSRSVLTMEKYREEYPSIAMFIDVHRDAGKTHEEGTDYVVIDGQKVARMMFVVGTGEGATGTGFGEKPDFNANYALAKAITERLLAVHPGLMRNIRVKTGRYNQHISNQCLLVEIGHNINTFEEALAAVPYLAEAIAACADGDAAQSGTAALPLLP